MRRPPAVGALVDLGRGLRRRSGTARAQLRPVLAGRGPHPQPGTEGPADGPVRLVAVCRDERAVLHNLMQLYRHDLSEFRDYELSERGTYAYDYLDLYLREPGREAWFVRVEERLAGFVLTRIRDDGVWQVSELFVARPYRRQGVGRVVLRLAFQSHPGRWACFVDDLNETSKRMCTDVATAATDGDYREQPGATSGAGFVGTGYELTVPEPARGPSEASS
ncbi:MAG: GNAT family N-acetyltransferase [Acidimicrobiia bacterium]|nr:GNAT family N-acetyltransferase [Acidimicrobiia bacterium]